LEVSHPSPDQDELPDIMVSKHIPEYLNVDFNTLADPYSKITVRQYKGYLLDLSKHSSAEQYIKAQLSNKSRKNLRRLLRKLEANHEIHYKFYHGDIDKAHYDYLFDCFYTLLKQRFSEKKLFNKNLLLWKDYHELFLPKIRNKEASLFVIYDKEKPITLTLNFHVKNLVFSYIQTYDIDYSYYNMGDISHVKHLEWCYQNDYKIFDLLIGVTGNKLKWSNYHYNTYFHLLYNPRKLSALFRLCIEFPKLYVKQILLDKGILGQRFEMDQINYYTKRKLLENHDWRKD
jgi:CelD/BcsL family acetyltransferase involved in cellulose biosynthesis